MVQRRGPVSVVLKTKQKREMGQERKNENDQEQERDCRPEKEEYRGDRDEGDKLE